jgi:hypothetical protein
MTTILIADEDQKIRDQYIFLKVNPAVPYDSIVDLNLIQFRVERN